MPKQPKYWDIEEVKFLLTQGLNIADISRKLQVSHTSLWKGCRKLGIEPKDYYLPKPSVKRSAQRRRILLKQLPNFCQICSFNRFLELAHIVPAELNGPEELWNVLALCPNHHRLFDRDRLTQEEFAQIAGKIKIAWEQFQA